MFEQTLAEQAFFFLDIKGQGPLISTKISKIKAALFLIFEAFTGVLMVLGVFLSAEDVYAALASVTALATVNQTVTKGIILLLHKDDFLDGMDILKHFWLPDRFGNESNRKMINYQIFVKKVLRLFRIAIVITASLYLSRPLLEGKRMLPMVCYTLCDMESNACYISHYIFLVLSLTSQLITLVGFDGLFFTLLMCAYSELEQIKYAFNNLTIKENESDQNEILDQMITIIKHHNLVLKYIAKFVGLFQTTLLSQFGTTIFSYCSGLFILTVSGFPPPAGEFLRSGPYVVSVFFQILIYCAVGEKIAEQTECLADIAYETKWSVSYQPKFRKMILLFMQRAQRRSQITAGGIWDLNMSTFASILKGSMSMLAFMQTVYRNKN